jgi:hypothetical protein
MSTKEVHHENQTINDLTPESSIANTIEVSPRLQCIIVNTISITLLEPPE